MKQIPERKTGRKHILFVTYLSRRKTKAGGQKKMDEQQTKTKMACTNT